MKTKKVSKKAVKTKKTPTKDIDIVIVLDRSGSMVTIRTDMEGALNDYIRKQKKATPKAKLTLATFDDNYEVVHNGVNVKDVGNVTIDPRGYTALYDAIGKTIKATEVRLGKKKKTVLFIIVTDGQENASQEYTSLQITDLINSHKKLNWDFIFLGANQDAIASGGQIGIAQGKSMTYATGTSAVKSIGKTLSMYTARCCVSNMDDNTFLDSERDDATSKQ